jgi:hypothetical protein
MAFRLQVVPPGPLAAAGIGDNTGLLARDGYPAPCRYLSRPYPGLSKDAHGLANRSITGVQGR